MNTADLYRILTSATELSAVEKAITSFESEQAGAVSWVPLSRQNNRGTVEASADPGRALIERLTNGTDAVLEAEHDAHHGVPNCRSPREAAAAWLGVPDRGLSALDQGRRKALAQRVSIQLLPGEDRFRRIVEVRDTGIGLKPAEMPNTILSLNESNKMSKHYLAGAYGQGGSATYAVSRFTVIASRHDATPVVGFTVVRYMDLPPEDFKIGHYVYLAVNGVVPSLEVPLNDFPGGTVVRHYGYDLSQYTSPVGPGSLYGLLQRALFDPVLPVWLDNRIHNYRRTIKGVRNALNGAVDEGDESGAPKLSHSVPIFYVSLGDFGSIGIEYWLVQPSEKQKLPSAGYVDPYKPIVLTLNGQSHSEFSGLLVRKYAELPFLRFRLICHIDCNALTADAKRLLFVSNREDARRGQVRDLVQAELVRVLNSDDDLTRLNQEAKQMGQKEEDENAAQQMRQEVARLLNLQGLPITRGATAVATKGGDTTELSKHPRPPRPAPVPRPPLELHEPPTYIHIVWPDEPVPFHTLQRRYVRVETDANSNYHTPQKPEASRINVILEGGDIGLAGTTPLTGGRMRIILGAKKDPAVGATGRVRVELFRPGLPTLTDERPISIVEAPKAKQRPQQLTLPPFTLKPVEGKEDPNWNLRNWPEDVDAIACDTEVEDSTLVIYYSTVFPQYATRLAKLEKQDTVLAGSFRKRYEIWLAVHALLQFQDEKIAEAEVSPGEQLEAFPEDQLEARDNQERCRLAIMSALFAENEIHQSAMASASALDAAM
ncbi:MAG: hypothetical protein QOH92_211 [Chloroflexota bacterium]|nr:hypothetical protein [Chloroflexota bacterium]